jgi:hypothetical protein
LETLYGRGFGEKNLRRMVQFATVFPEAETVAALRRQSSWAHFKLLIPLKDSLRREFYAEMCRVEGWSTRSLAQKIDGMLFERTALSKKPEALIRKELSALREKGELSTAIVFRDPYMLDFLELADTYSERTWSRRSSARLSASLSSWERASPSSNGRSASRSTATTTTSTSCSSTGACSGSSPSS